MSVGTLKAAIVLNSASRLHCGPNDPVKGKVRVRYEPPQKQPDAELFGPVKISITAYGRLKTKLKPEKETFRSRVQLFQKRRQVYDGSIRIMKGEVRDYPFEFNFPQGIANSYNIFGGWQKKDTVFNLDPKQPLPPTMDFSRMGFSSNGEAHVEYKVGVAVAMPSIDVSTQANNEIMIKYERPRMTTLVRENPTVFRGFLAVKDKCLIPEEDRPNPQGFMEKTTSMFQVVHRPFCKFKWTMSAPQQFHRGQPLLLRVRFQPVVEECTAPVLPVIKLQNVSVRVYARLEARTEVHIFNEPRYSGENEVGSRTVRADEVPFSEENDWMRVVAVNSVTNLASSVRTICIQQSYMMKITATVSIAGKDETIKGQHCITIHPPLVEEPVDGQGSSGEVMPAVQREDEDSAGLPAYEPGESPPAFKDVMK